MLAKFQKIGIESFVSKEKGKESETIDSSEELNGNDEMTVSTISFNQLESSLASLLQSHINQVSSYRQVEQIELWMLQGIGRT